MLKTPSCPWRLVPSSWFKFGNCPVTILWFTYLLVTFILCIVFHIKHNLLLQQNSFKITIFINLNLRGRSYDSNRGGGGRHYLKIKMLTLKKLTLNNLSSKYFAIVGDTSAIFSSFKKFSLASATSLFQYIHCFHNRQFYPIVDA